jgi:hypothetical protein
MGKHAVLNAGAGTECAVFHWLATSTIDELFDKYAEGNAITFASFKRLVSCSTPSVVQSLCRRL